MSSNPASKPTHETVKLDYPVTFEGETHEVCKLRRLKGKDIRKLGAIKDETDQTFFLMQELSGWPPEAFDEMDAIDFEKIGEKIEGFTERPGRQPRRKTSAS